MKNLNLKGETHDSRSIHYQQKAEYSRAWKNAWQYQRCLPEVRRVSHALLRHQIRYRGREGLEELLEKSRKAPRLANRVAPEIEQKVLDYSLEYPTQGQKRVANELKKQGIQVYPNKCVNGILYEYLDSLRSRPVTQDEGRRR